MTHYWYNCDDKNKALALPFLSNNEQKRNKQGNVSIAEL